MIMIIIPPTKQTKKNNGFVVTWSPGFWVTPTQPRSCRRPIDDRHDRSAETSSVRQTPKSVTKTEQYLLFKSI